MTPDAPTLAPDANNPVNTVADPVLLVELIRLRDSLERIDAAEAEAMKRIRETVEPSARESVYLALMSLSEAISSAGIGRDR